jgi:L-Ala-D/L-Glu epimerase
MPARIERFLLQPPGVVRTAAGAIDERPVFIVTVSDRSGIWGIGEAAPLPRFGGEDAARCAEALARAVERIDDGFLERLSDTPGGVPEFAEFDAELAQTPCARHALEGALIDFLARHRGVPLASLLNERATHAIPVNALLIATDDPALEREARTARARGFTTFKMKISGDHARDLERIAVIRTAIGPEARLRVDVNGGWTFEQARKFSQSAAPFALDYYEQPLAANDVAGHRRLRSECAMRIALDESVRSAADIANCAGACDVVVLKPMLLGGWQPTALAVDAAQSSGLNVVISSSLESSVGRAYAAHIAAALRLKGLAHGLALTSTIAGKPIADPLTVRDGHITTTNVPGLGIAPP